MSTLTFDEETARLQRALTVCHDLVVRRSAVLQALNLRSGERVLEVGCGGGSYAYEAAQFVGPDGSVSATDISDAQVAAAREYCADLPCVDCKLADLVNLPYEDGSFDVVFASQVLEYVPCLDEALMEIHRVLRPGGRMVILATNWSSLVWYSAEPERMKQILAAWDEHATYPDLPAMLPARLRSVGMQPLRQIPVPIVNMSYNRASFSYWIARMIKRYVTGRNTVPAQTVDAWLGEFDDLEKQGSYFFSSTPILTEALKIS
ncbi:MAG TPA: methyltransferase domain-containing protein [Deltaproteobacteria bacterium]|nr:methyltransferase domain-containing protein [Deltaproteobacteria bacterium]